MRIILWFAMRFFVTLCIENWNLCVFLFLCSKETRENSCKFQSIWLSKFSLKFPINWFTKDIYLYTIFVNMLLYTSIGEKKKTANTSSFESLFSTFSQNAWVINPLKLKGQGTLYCVGWGKSWAVNVSFDFERRISH